MEAVDVLHAIERLVVIARSAPGIDSGAMTEVTAILSPMRLGEDPSGYKAEKLAAVSKGFEAWQSSGRIPGQLLHDIEKLRKALARGSGGQD
jgi:hypothetical protein